MTNTKSTNSNCSMEDCGAPQYKAIKQEQINSEIVCWINILQEQPVSESDIEKHILCHFNTQEKRLYTNSALFEKLWETILEHQKVSSHFLYKQCPYIPWRYLSANVEMSEDFVTEYLAHLDWVLLARHKKLPTSILNQMYNINPYKIPWVTLVRYQDLEEEFIKKHGRSLRWDLVYKYQKMSPPFMDKHAHKLNWLALMLNNDFPKEISTRYIHISNPTINGRNTLHNMCSHPNVMFKDIDSPLTNAEFAKNLPYIIKGSHTLNQLYDTSDFVTFNSFWRVRRSKIEWSPEQLVPVPPINLNIFYDKKETNCKETLALSITFQAITPKKKYDTILFNAIKMESDVLDNKVRQIVRKTKRTMSRVANSIGFDTPHLVYAQQGRVLAVGACLGSDSEWLRSTASAYILMLALQQPMQGITLRNVAYCTFEDFLDDIRIEGWGQSGYTWKDVQRLMKTKLDIMLANERIGYNGIMTACTEAELNFPYAWSKDE